MVDIFVMHAGVLSVLCFRISFLCKTLAFRAKNVLMSCDRFMKGLVLDTIMPTAQHFDE